MGLLKKLFGGKPETKCEPAQQARIVPESPDPVKAPTKTGAAGVALIKQFEGCHKPIGQGRFQAYPDPGTGGKPWTIGWGSTTDAEGKPIVPGTVWTQAQCDAQLVRDLARFEREVAQAVAGAPTTQNQFDAMVSFHYNTGAIARSTLLRKHRAGDYAGAQAEYGRWNKAAGKVLAGLTRRRAAEAELYGR
ncbi:lysozyme [Novosphingobium sp. NPDC080210]|uniref:lysozyme n=1 Tax=Novosphingobium sp. NPDC080210 TaxID=3390596 RepID=UPI003D04F054